MTTDPLSPQIDKWLRSLEPRQELVVRFAMRERFASVRGDRAFIARVDELRDKLKPDEDRLAMIIADARMVAGSIEELLGDQ